MTKVFEHQESTHPFSPAGHSHGALAALSVHTLLSLPLSALFLSIDNYAQSHIMYNCLVHFVFFVCSEFQRRNISDHRIKVLIQSGLLKSFSNLFFN